ncbi:quinone-dependent dihydroorotate dehydrogenase [Sphingomonas glaciei]|uniref:Dihydroorotate dehydrogenase (quinone) n=1 Tax=Sphingomonas glaciei TaxID=2938948 RepID=A0ABY5MT77_9SPHN|nr:quinone-dependent dihydroorotate dehydrogenase [Sphingomonas glaciei]UUR07373.1 quinone-dependent dihydroorotate dehydrogenase [Sphingomonas glaciei]
MALYPLLRPLFFSLDAERAHRLSIAGLKALPVRKPPAFDPVLASEVAGLRFPSPIGLAAGYDKDAEVFEAMLGNGFGFVEVGTLTPKPQPGNPKPRMFRLVEDGAVINRLGFNNGGQDAALGRLQARRGRGIVGVNIGANKDSPDRIRDYAEGVRRMAPVADYLTVNISSPNTPGLRNLQAGGELGELLAAVREARQVAFANPPVFLKVAPDLDEGDPIRIVRAVADHGIDGIIVSNTTVSRPPMSSRHRDETGGLSGVPLASLAMHQLKAFYAVTGGQVPLISAGGIATPYDAWRRICAGANLVQLYSAMVYEGPGIARDMARGLVERLATTRFSTLAEAVGSNA